MNKQQPLQPQPENLGHQVWRYTNEIYIGDEVLQSHLFHNVYGEQGSPLGSVYSDGTSEPLDLVDIHIELIDGIWMWVAEYSKNSLRDKSE